MPLTKALATFGSRAVRNAITNTGVRRIARSALTFNIGGSGGTSTNTPIPNQAPGTVEAIWKGFSRFGGFLLDNVKTRLAGNSQGINFTKIWGLLVRAGSFLFNFNWNITDAALDAQVKQGAIALAGAAGGALGNALGYLICGGIPSVSLAAFNPALALHVMTEVGENAAEEIVGNVANLIRLTALQLVRYTFATVYKNYRSILRPAALGVAQKLVNLGILSQASVDAANKERNQPWSFAIALNNTIDEIKDPIKKGFIEEFVDELADSCIESGYVIAGALDGFFAQQKMANEMYFGRMKTVEILPNRSAI